MEPTRPTPKPIQHLDMPKKRTRLWIIIVAIAVVLIVGITWLALWLYNQNKMADLRNQQTQKGPTVSITATGFSPAVIHIKANQQLAWVMQDTRGHQLTANQSLPGFTTPEPLAAGDSYSYTFETAGTYNYYDPADPQQFKGTVIVE